MNDEFKKWLLRTVIGLVIAGVGTKSGYIVNEWFKSLLETKYKEGKLDAKLETNDEVLGWQGKYNQAMFDYMSYRADVESRDPCPE